MPADPALVAGDREPAQLQAEDQREHQPQPERRASRTRRSSPSRSTLSSEPLGRSAARIASGTPITSASDERVHDQRRARADPLADDRADGRVEGERLAELALHGVGDVQPELRQQRPVEDTAEWRTASIAAGRGADPEHDPHGVPGDEMDDEERGDEQAEQHHHGQRHPADQIGSPSGASARRRRLVSRRSALLGRRPARCPRDGLSRARRCRCRTSSPRGR